MVFREASEIGPAAAMAKAATAATIATATPLAQQLQALVLALESVLAMNARTLASATEEWAAPTLHVASTWTCIRNLLAALLAWCKPTPAPGVMAAR